MPMMPEGGDHYWVISGLRITNREKKPVVLHFQFRIPWPRGGLGIPSEPMGTCPAIVHPLEADRATHWSHSVRIDAEDSASGHLDFFFSRTFVDSLRAADMKMYHDGFALPNKKFLEIHDDLSGRSCAHDMNFQEG
jgi:hypothetical protein